MFREYYENTGKPNKLVAKTFATAHFPTKSAVIYFPYIISAFSNDCPFLLVIVLTSSLLW